MAAWVSCVAFEPPRDPGGSGVGGDDRGQLPGGPPALIHQPRSSVLAANPGRAVATGPGRARFRSQLVKSGPGG